MHVLSLALLFAQLGMVVHASSHLKADPHATPTQQQLCGECASFAPMQNMVGGAPTVVLAVHVSHDRALDCAAVCQRSASRLLGVPFPRSTCLLLNNK